MAGFTDILGSMILQGMSPSRSSRVTNAFGKRSGDLADVLDSIGQVLGHGSSEPPRSIPQPQPQTRRPSAAPSAHGGGLGEIIGSLAGNKAVLGGLAALAAAILGGKSSGSSRSPRKSVGHGWLAMLATLAFAALKHAGQTPRRTPRALMDARSAQDADDLEQDAEIIVKAMISAAKADGQIDDTEIQNIIGRLEQDGLSDEEKNFFLDEAKKQPDINAVIDSANGQPDMAAQIYAASLLAIEVDTPGEQQYIRDLAKGLNLPPEVTDHIKRSLGMT